MRKALIYITAGLSCLLFIVICIGSITIVAQTPITGEWRIESRSHRPDRPARPHRADNDDEDEPGMPREDMSGKVNIQFEHWRAGNGHNSIGQNYSYAELGLTEQQVQSGGPVRFRLAREAGTVDGEGTCASGDCKGTFTFTPNGGYLSAMRAKGFDFEDPKRGIRFDKDDAGKNSVEERLLSAALLNVTTALADDLNSANFGQLDVDDLFKAAIFHIDGKYAAEMKSTGFPNLTFEDLVKGRIFKIDANYVRQVHDMGFDNRSFEGLVKFRIFKVTPEFLNELKTAGLQNLESEDIVKARIFHIDGDYVRKARAEKPDATIEDMVRMKIGVGRNRGGDWQ